MKSPLLILFGLFLPGGLLTSWMLSFSASLLMIVLTMRIIVVRTKLLFRHCWAGGEVEPILCFWGSVGEEGGGGGG